MHVTYRQLKKIMENLDEEKLDDYVVVEVLCKDKRLDGDIYHLDIDVVSNTLVVDTY